MNLIVTKVRTHEYGLVDEMIKEIRTSKYLFGIRISRTFETIKTPIPPITSITVKTATMGEVLIEEGMRVIVRGNEPDELMICEVTGFTNMGGKMRKPESAFPVIRDEADGKEYFSMGIILPYSDELFNELKDLKPIEQWNYLTFPHGQIKEKYGIKYKTFR